MNNLKSIVKLSLIKLIGILNRTNASSQK